MEQRNNKPYGNERNYTFDNIKVILIFLVVFGHLINVVYTEKPLVIQIIWIIIYTFHMPLFVIISGYFSKGYSDSLKADKILTGLLIPYLVFNTIFCVLDRKIIIPILPDSAMWYLYALMIWRILLPLLTKIKYILPLSVILALLTIFVPAGMDNGSLKIIKYLPFFLAGYYMTPEIFTRIKKISKLKSTLFFVLISLCLCFVFYAAKIGISDEILYVRPENQSMDIILGKILTLIFGISVCFYLIIMIPNRKLLISSIAKNTLMVYLFHYLPIFRKIYRLIIPSGNLWLSISAMILLSIILVWLFSRSFVFKMYSSVMKIINRILFKKKYLGSENNA